MIKSSGNLNYALADEDVNRMRQVLLLKVACALLAVIVAPKYIEHAVASDGYRVIAPSANVDDILVTQSSDDVRPMHPRLRMTQAQLPVIISSKPDDYTVLEQH